MFRSCFMAGVVLAGFGAGLVRGAEELPPPVKVQNIRCVFDNGEHNAFTDLTRYNGRFYLAFRTCPDGHGIHDTSAIVVLSSEEATSWKEVYRFSVKGRDVRDPHFLVYRERLFVYTGTWFCGDKPPGQEEFTLNMHLGYGAWSDDGAKWHGPIMLEGTFGHYVWRAAAAPDGKAYLCGRRNRDFAAVPRGQRDLIEAVMLESEDGLIWRKRAFFQEEKGDETAFQFEADGSVLAVARRGIGLAEVCQSRPPYTQWHRHDLDRYVGGPLLMRWGERWVVGGRKMIDRAKPTTSFCWLIDGQLREFAELPSAGDNSYPGMVVLSERQALVSWYSSHERDEQGRVRTAIYLGELVLGEH